MLFLNRLKILLRRKETFFWVLLFPILLASAEYLAFGNFIHSTPIETIQLGITTNEYQLTDDVLTIFKEATIDEDKKLYQIIEFDTLENARSGLENDEAFVIVYQEDEVKIIAKENSTALTVTKSIVSQVDVITKTIEDAYQKYAADLKAGLNPLPVEPQKIIAAMTADNNYVQDISNNKDATFYTVYFYALMAMACLYASLMGLSIITDVRADRSSLGIRISSSVVPKWKVIFCNFMAAILLQLISSVVLYVYLAYILKVSLGSHVFLSLLTLILGSIAGLSVGMLVGAFVKGEKKSESILVVVTLSLSVLAGLMSVDVKHLVDTYASFINWFNPAALITDSLYALYYYDNFQKYIIYTCLLAGFSVIVLLIVLFKTRGEKYASL